jgi:hypothetical protein
MRSHGSFGVSTAAPNPLTLHPPRNSRCHWDCFMSADVCLFPSHAAGPRGNCPTNGLDAHQAFITAARNLYAPSVVWTAPSRGIQWQGCEVVIRQLLREASGMHDPEFTLLRRNQGEQQIIDEFAVRFIYMGQGIDNAPIATGDFVELKRVRVLDMRDNRCVHETCIESWSVLLPSEKNLL